MQLRVTPVFCFSVFLALALACGACSHAPTKKELSKTERARILVEMANGLLDEGDPTSALESLIRAESEDPKLPEIHHSKALAFFARKNLAEALKAAEKAVELAPTYSSAQSTLGKLLLDSGRMDEAILHLNIALADPVNRELFKPLSLLGVIYYKKSEFSKAGEFFNRAIDSAPANACIAYYYRGHLHLRDSQFEDAIRDYDQASKRFCGAFSEAHLAIGITYEESKRFELARKKFLEIEQRFPNTRSAEQAMKRLRTLP
ncbi:tetratricopeptide repeat protein [Bdellovibrionota bacterium FG-2]